MYSINRGTTGGGAGGAGHPSSAGTLVPPLRSGSRKSGPFSFRHHCRLQQPLARRGGQRCSVNSLGGLMPATKR